MVWLVTAAVLAATLPAEAAQQDGVPRERASHGPGPLAVWATAPGCERILAGEGRDGWFRLCMPANTLTLRSSFAWHPWRWHEPAGSARSLGKAASRGEARDERERDERGERDEPHPGSGLRRSDDASPPAGDGTCVTGIESNCTATVTPEPVTMVLLGSGLAGIAGLRLRRRRRGPGA